MGQLPPKTGVRVTYTNTLLVDGNALFKVGYFGAKDQYNHRGEHIGGVYQFLTILRKVLESDLYHRVYVFWDGNFSGKLRHEFYEPYKGNRNKDFVNGTHPIDENELRERKIIKVYLNELSIRQLEDQMVEGDDLIAYYCSIRKPDEKISIVTNDRDMSQLLNEYTRIYFCDLKQYVTTSNYNDFFKHHQENIGLIKTITGDSSDNIKGIKGVKEKTLLTLFPELKQRKVSLEELLILAEKLQSERVSMKKKPLKTLQNILECNTEGVQGKSMYIINDKLVNLYKPLITEEAIEKLMILREGEFETFDTSFKNVLEFMRIDGMREAIGRERYGEYLLPFKRLLEREFNNQKLTNK